MNQKGTIRIVALAVVLSIALGVLCSCGSRLSGMYVNNDGIVQQSVVFEGDTVTISTMGLNITGKYKVEGDELLITYHLGDLSYTQRSAFQMDKNSVIIDGTRFTKSN